MAVPGVDVAVHTDEALLPTGAWMDFSEHVRALMLRGDETKARQLWDSVFEVVHLGVDPATPVLQNVDLAPSSSHAML